MSRTQLDTLLSQIRAAREETLRALADVTEDEFTTPTNRRRWDDLRRVLLRFGEHMREHASQIEGIRADIGDAPTPPQRMLAEAELSWGKLLAATVNLTDDDLLVSPPTGGWTVGEALAHILEEEKGYLGVLLDARRK